MALMFMYIWLNRSCYNPLCSVNFSQGVKICSANYESHLATRSRPTLSTASILVSLLYSVIGVNGRLRDKKRRKRQGDIAPILICCEGQVGVFGFYFGKKIKLREAAKA